MTAAEIISLVGVMVGAGAFVSGYFQYVKAQKWKRAEFVAKEIKAFESRPKVKLAMQILDWNARRYDIGGSEDEKGVLISDRVLQHALRPHTSQSDYSVVEVRIRDIFDTYFEALERFDHFIESDLVSPREFRPYLIYWLDIIGNSKSDRKPRECREAIWKYLDFYGYDGVVRLLSRYGYDVAVERM